MWVIILSATQCRLKDNTGLHYKSDNWNAVFQDKDYSGTTHKLGVDVLHKFFTTHSTTWLFAAVYVSPHQPQTLIDWTILSLSLHLPLSIVFMQGFVIPRKILDQGPHVKNSMGIPPGIHQEIEDEMR